MPTCKDCLCYEACGYHIDEETTMTVNECSTGFKSKDQYIKLPAYIGQSVWRIRSKYNWTSTEFKIIGYELEQGKVSMIQQKADKSWKFRVTITSSVMDFAVADIGKHIFFSEFEAIEEMHRLEKELD
jgi:hypothetical protein